MSAGGPASGRDLPSLALDMEAADRAMTCGGIGLRAYAEASGLDPAADFRGLDLRGWELDGQDLRGFDLTGCDLRASGVESALINGSTRLEGAIWDEGAEPGSRHEGPALTRADLTRIARTARELHDRNETKDLAAAGRFLLPFLETLFGPDDVDVLILMGYVGFGELREGDLSSSHTHLKSIVERSETLNRSDIEYQHLLWRYYYVESLDASERSKEALIECEALITMYNNTLGNNSENALIARGLKAAVLLNLGRAEEALFELESVLPLCEAKLGSQSASTLCKRLDKARALEDVGRPEEALAEFDALLGIYGATHGAGHPNVITTRQYRTGTLLSMGRPDAALSELNALLLLIDTGQRASEPATIITHLYKARALLDLGRADEALTELDIVSLAYKASKGEAHWWVSAARSDEIGARMALGETGFATELARIADHISRERHPSTESALRTRYRLVRDLITAGAIDRARTEAAVVAALATSLAVSRHRYVKATLDLIAGLDGIPMTGRRVY